MAKIPGLQKRRQGYYVRVRIPQDLVDIYQKKEILRSLKTRDYDRARQRIHLERAKIESEFDEMRKHDNQNDILSGYDRHQLEGIVLRWLSDKEKAEAKQKASDSHSYTDKEIEDAMLELKIDVNLAQRELQGYEDEGIHRGRTAAARFLDKRKITYDLKSQAFAELGEMFSKAIYEDTQRTLRYLEGKPFASTHVMFTAQPQVPQKHENLGPAGQITVTALFDEYLNDPEMHRSASTLKNYTIILRALEEMIGGDRPIHEVTRQEYKAVRKMLLRYPSNAQKKAPNKSIREQCRLAKERHWPTVSLSTVNGYLDKLKAVLNYAEREGYLYRNPAKGLSVNDRLKNKDKRQPFDVAQLNLIFQAPLYTGCKNDGTGYAVTGNQRPRRERFWIPLIALWTGMRLNEICQLEVSDIVDRDGIDLILVQDTSEEDTKTIKTEAGHRFIPIHPELKKIGFLGYVEKMRNSKHNRLFPDLKKSANGYYSDTFSKWFARFLEKAGAKKPKTQFHSFRHNYRDALREAETPRDAALQLGGWSSGNTDDDYGAGLKPGTLYKHICKIKYPGLDLSHLHEKK